MSKKRIVLIVLLSIFISQRNVGLNMYCKSISFLSGILAEYNNN